MNSILKNFYIYISIDLFIFLNIFPHINTLQWSFQSILKVNSSIINNLTTNRSQKLVLITEPPLLGLQGGGFKLLSAVMMMVILHYQEDQGFIFILRMMAMLVEVLLFGLNKLN